MGREENQQQLGGRQHAGSERVGLTAEMEALFSA